MINVKNGHGEFELEIGGTYEFTLIQTDSGQKYPIDDAEVVKDNGDSISVVIKDGLGEEREEELIPKDIIVQVILT